MAHTKLSAAVTQLLEEELQYCVAGSTPLPAFIAEAKGTRLKDVDGKEYIDFLCGFNAVNLGHSHPVVLNAVTAQLSKGALINLSSHTAIWPQFAKMMCKRFGYDKIASLVTGTEAVDAACKIARKWAIAKKNVSPDDVLVFGVEDCFHGLAMGVWGLQNRSSKRYAYGLDDKHMVNYNPSTKQILGYGNLDDMRGCLEEHHSRTAAVILECVRGSLRSEQDEIDYAIGVRDLCTKYDVLFIADEVRMGMGKTGRMLSSDCLGEARKPDLVTLGKSITGGMYPASFVLGREEATYWVETREISSTYAFNPVAIAAVTAVLKVIDSEGLLSRAVLIGMMFQERANAWTRYEFIDYASATGAVFGITFRPGKEWLCRRIGALCMHRGLLVFPKDLYLRMSAAMTMKEEELILGLDILESCLEDGPTYGYVAGETFKSKL